MAQPLSKEVLDSAVNPEVISEQSFDVVRRGFSQRQVQEYLVAVADALRDAQNREADMRRRMGKAVRRAEAAEKELRNVTPVTEADDSARQIGDEVATVLEAARLAGDQTVALAKEEADKIRLAAKAEATEMRSAAVTMANDRQAQAENAKSQLVSEGQAEAQSLRQQARADAEAMLAQAVARVEQARTEGDNLIQEASEARAQILEDMERRRRQARVQVERLRVGRDRLLRSYELVRRTLDETTGELKISLKEAKLRGDSAARAISVQPLASRDELEEELRGAQLIGRSAALPRPLADATARARHDSDAASEGETPRPRKPIVSDSSRSKIPAQPKAPAFAPVLSPSRGDQDAEAPDPVSADSVRADSDSADRAVDESLATTAALADTAASVSALGAPPAIDPDEDVDGDGLIDITDEAMAAELAQLADDDLNVIEPSDEIEEVLALPLDAPDSAATAAPEEAPAETTGLFAALRAQRGGTRNTPATAEAKKSAKKSAAEQAKKSAKKTPAEQSKQSAKKSAAEQSKKSVKKSTAEQAKKSAKKSAAERAKQSAKKSTAEQSASGAVTPVPVDPGDDQVDVSPEASPATPANSQFPGIAAQRDAVIADAAKQLEKRLKRALADEQNELLAGLRKTKRKKQVALAGLVGDPDIQLRRYVTAINEVAAVTYGAGAALIDAEAEQGRLPAGAVEELLVADVVSPIRDQLETLDRMDVASADMHVDPVRSFYRQRKTDHLGDAATRLAHLLCVAGVCDALPAKAPLPWAATTN